MESLREAFHVCIGNVWEYVGVVANLCDCSATWEGEEASQCGRNGGSDATN